MMATTKIIVGNRAAVITSNDAEGPFTTRIWVNARNGIEQADPTRIVGWHKTMARAIKWAQKELAA